MQNLFNFLKFQMVEQHYILVYNTKIYGNILTKQMQGFQIFIIVFSVVVAVVLVLINSFILKTYIHPDDKGVKKSLYGKILIVFGLTICQGQALMVPLDVALKSAGIDNANCIQNCSQLHMGFWWMILYIVLLVLVCLLIPFAIFFYQSDPQNSFPRRICRALCYLSAVIIIQIMIFFITWFFFKYADIPYTELSLAIDQTEQSQKTVAVQKQIVGVEASLAIYVIAILSFVGWFPVVFFGGVGLFALPIDLINQFRFRPKVRKSQEMGDIKDKLVKEVNTLIKEGQSIKQFDDNYQKNQQAGCLERFKGQRKTNTKFTKFKVKYHLLSQSFQTFNLQLKLSDTNPIIPYLKLILGILFLITSILWVVQIVLGNVAKLYNNGQPLIMFLNTILIFMDERNAGLISTILFVYLCMYLMWCVQKGNIKMGMRIPFCCRFYPMKENATALNGFLVNVLTLIFASVGVIQLCLSSFPTYTRQAEINTILNVQIKFMRFYTIFYNYSIFPAAMIAWSVLTLLYLLITCNRAPGYMKQVYQIRKYHRDELQKLND